MYSFSKKITASFLTFMLVIGASVMLVSAPKSYAYEGGTFDNSYASQALTLSNQERAKEGKDALVEDPRLTAAARIRAKEIVDLWAHQRPGEKTDVFTAIEGYESITNQSNTNYIRVGENIARGQKTPALAVTAWMNSAGHRANIMGNYNVTGVACYRARGGYYWVQLFAWDTEFDPDKYASMSTDYNDSTSTGRSTSASTLGLGTIGTTSIGRIGSSGLSQTGFGSTGLSNRTTSFSPASFGSSFSGSRSISSTGFGGSFSTSRYSSTNFGSYNSFNSSGYMRSGTSSFGSGYRSSSSFGSGFGLSSYSGTGLRSTSFGGSYSSSGSSYGYSNLNSTNYFVRGLYDELEEEEE